MAGNKRVGNRVISILNVNPSEKSPTFKLWDESHGGLRPKRREAFSPPGGGATTFTVVPQVKDLSVCNVILVCSNKTHNTHLGWKCTKRYITLF